MKKLFKESWSRGLALAMALAMVLTLIPSYTVSAKEITVVNVNQLADDGEKELKYDEVTYDGGERYVIPFPDSYVPESGDVIKIDVVMSNTEDVIDCHFQYGWEGYKTTVSKSNPSVVYTVGDDPSSLFPVQAGTEADKFRKIRFKFDNVSGGTFKATLTVTRNVPELIKDDVAFTMAVESGDFSLVDGMVDCIKTEAGGTGTDNNSLRGALEFPKNFEVEADKFLIIKYETSMSSIDVEYGYGSSSADTMGSHKCNMSKDSDTLVIKLTSDHVAFFEKAKTDGTIARLRLKASSSEAGDYIKINSVRYGDIEGEVPVVYPTVVKGIAGSNGGNIQSIESDDLVALTYTPDSSSTPYFHIDIAEHNVKKYSRMKIVLTPSREGMKLGIGGIKGGWSTFEGWYHIEMPAGEKQEYIIDLPENMDFIRFWLDNGYGSTETLTFRVHSIEFIDPNATADSCAVSLKSQDAEGNTSIANLSMNVTTPVAAGTSVTVKANDLLNYTFDGWYDGDTFLTANFSHTFSISEDTNLVAKYTKKANATATITIEEGTDYTVTGATRVGDSNQYTASIGSEVTVTANNTDGKFINWSNASDKIVTTVPSYKFILTGDETLKMSQKGTDGSTSRVEFLSDYNQVVSVGTYSVADNIELPKGPSKMGYTFKEWNLTVAQIKEMIEENAHITVKPVYTQIDKSYAVQVFVDGKMDNDLSKDYNFGENLSVTAPYVFNKVFQYWADENGNILGYDKTYFTQISKPIVVKAVYGDNAIANAKPIITMSNVFATTDSDVNKVSFSATRSVPAGYMVIEHGIIANRTNFVNPTNDNFVIGAEGVTKFKSENTSEIGVYTLNVSVTDIEADVVARGYMIISDGIRQEIYYTDVVSKSFSDVNVEE